MKIAKISNPNSPYFNKKAKVLNYLPNEEVELFILEDEVLVYLKLDDIAQQASKISLPKSRKDFYEYILEPKTCRANIIDTIKKMAEQNIVVLSESTSIEALTQLVQNEDKDKQQIVEEFRMMRDEGKFEFKLTNNSFQHKKPFKKKNRNPNHKSPLDSAYDVILGDTEKYQK